MNGRIRVVVCDDNPEFCEIISTAINSQDDMECVACVHDGLSALSTVDALQPDFLILDHVMPKLDGFGVLTSLRDVESRPKVIMLTAFGQEHLVKQAAEMGADYYIMKPFDVPTLVERVRQLADPKRAIAHFQYEQRRQQVEHHVARELSLLGVPPHFKGYLYLKDSVTLVVLEPELLTAVTKQLYPMVARMRNTSAHKVERAIRHAIESTWMRGNLKFIDELFSYTVDVNKGKPTNSSFIARLADHVRTDLMVS